MSSPTLLFLSIGAIILLANNGMVPRFLFSEKDSVERRCRSLEQQISQLTGNDTAERQMQRLQDENQMHRNTREEMENAIQVCSILATSVRVAGLKHCMGFLSVSGRTQYLQCEAAGA